MKKAALLAAAAVLSIALLNSAPPVSALSPVPEVTRESYAEEVEPICRRNVEANARILKGVRGQVSRGELKQAAARFARAADALRLAVGQLQAVPRPPADQETLSTWFGYLREEAKLLDLTSRKLRKGDRKGALQMSSRLIRTANKANREVIEFPFRYCRSSPSQFL